MIRISEEEGRGLVVLRVECSLGGSGVRQLRSACERLAGRAGRLRLDLSHVDFVDAAGSRLMLLLVAQPHVEVVHASPLVAEILRGAAS